jgi:uncharacterized Fe-S cluster-containing radical SAM superfamily protein
MRVLTIIFVSFLAVAISATNKLEYIDTVPISPGNTIKAIGYDPISSKSHHCKDKIHYLLEYAFIGDTNGAIFVVSYSW